MKILEKKYSRSLFKYLFLNVGRYSFTRLLQYYVISNEQFAGKLLDFGGGDFSTYINILGDCDYTSINICKDLNPTFVVRVGDDFPLEDNFFDHCISFNTLEHVYDCHQPLCEMFRVLKPSGQICVITPFLFYIHGHPDDYFRPTPSWFKNALSDVGFKSIVIAPLYYGPFTFTAEVSPFRFLKNRSVFRLMLILDYLFNKRPFKKTNGPSNRPLSLCVFAKK